MSDGTCSRDIVENSIDTRASHLKHIHSISQPIANFDSTGKEKAQYGQQAQQ